MTLLCRITKDLTMNSIVCGCPFCPIQKLMDEKDLDSLVFYFFVKYNKDKFKITRAIIPNEVDDTIKDAAYNAFLYYHQNKDCRNLPANTTHTEIRDDLTINIYKTKNYESKDGISVKLPLERKEKAFRMCIHKNV
jgi:hypothetical protein